MAASLVNSMESARVGREGGWWDGAGEPVDGAVPPGGRGQRGTGGAREVVVVVTPVLPPLVSPPPPATSLGFLTFSNCGA